MYLLTLENFFNSMLLLLLKFVSLFFLFFSHLAIFRNNLCIFLFILYIYIFTFFNTFDILITIAKLYSGGCTKSWFARISTWGKLDGEACVLCCVYLFTYCLFVCLLFIYFKGAVCWVIHQSCGLVSLEKGVGGYFCGVFWQFWWAISGLFCSHVGLMQDVMKSLS